MSERKCLYPDGLKSKDVLGFTLVNQFNVAAKERGDNPAKTAVQLIVGLILLYPSINLVVENRRRAREAHQIRPL